MKNLLKFLFFLLLTISIACKSKQKADAIYFNGKVYTADSTFTIAEAFAVKAGKIIAVGTSAEIKGKFSSDSLIDLLGKPVYPGFIDAHCHFYGYALNLQRVNLEGTKSFQDVIDRTKEYAATHPDADWIIGRGWDQNDWNTKEFPDKRVLDSIFQDKPVFLQRIDGHAALVNQAALSKAGINEKTIISGGVIEKQNGKLTGILIDNGVELVEKVIPKKSNKEISQALLSAQQNCFAVGLTTADDAGLDKKTVDLIDSLQKANALKMRIYAMLNPTEENENYYFHKGKYKTDRLNACSFKIYADGALGSRGACLLKPYSDKPRHAGFLIKDIAYFRTIAEKLYKYGFQMNTHCIGDSSNRLLLKIYASVLKGKNDKRWRIEHAQVVDPFDNHFFGDYNIIPSVQPTHATSDMYWAEQRLGPGRISSAYAYKDLMNQNKMIAAGSDFPVEDINPLYGFYAAVVRKDKKNFPEKGFEIGNSISREDALRAMTIWAAYANFEEKEKGSIEPGKFADFVILEEDIMKASSEKLWQIKVSKTYLNGENVYRK